MYVRTSSQVARGCRQVLIALLAVTVAAAQLASAAQAAPDNQVAATNALAIVKDARFKRRRSNGARTIRQSMPQVR